MRVELEHEDEPNELVFEDGEIDNLENYDYENNDDGEDGDDAESLIAGVSLSESHS